MLPGSHPIPDKTARALRSIAEGVRAVGGRAFLVGGCVRDALMDRAPKDFDLEVFGVEAEKLEALLRQKHKVDTVGRSFGVFKLNSLGLDVALPRRESKTGSGHKGFTVEGDPHLSPREAALRRDFTVNAISCDPLTGEISDPLDGVSDLQAKRLRHCGPQFGEDPLRVLRAMQFLARFEFEAAPETVALCATIGTEGLPAERLCEEWRKLIVQGVKPSLGLRFLRDCGWVRHYPELNALIGCPQDPRWHPEGDVWEHINHCLDAFARARVGDPWEDFIVGLAVLLHDVGKPLVTAMEDGRWRSRGHDVAGLPVARAFLERLTRQTAVFEEVLPLIEGHHQPHNLWQGNAGAGAVRRLAAKVGRLDRLARVVTADQSGRPPKAIDLSAVEWLLAKANELQVRESAPKRIVLGRHLIALGYAAGPDFRAHLDACYEAQLDDVFKDEAGGIAFLSQRLGNGKDEG